MFEKYKLKFIYKHTTQVFLLDVTTKLGSVHQMGYNTNISIFIVETSKTSKTGRNLFQKQRCVVELIAYFLTWVQTLSYVSDTMLEKYFLSKALKRESNTFQQFVYFYLLCQYQDLISFKLIESTMEFFSKINRTDIEL